MKNQLSTVTEVVVRSIFYITTNYVFVSMGLSFHTHWIAILFLLSMVWATIDYGKSVNKITGKKVIAEILCIKEIVVHERIDEDKTRHISIEIHFNLKPIPEVEQVTA